MSAGNSPRRVSDHVVHTLAKVLADAKAGSVHAVAVITVDPTGAPRVHFGGDGELVPSINLGADMLKAIFMRQAVEAEGATTMASGIVLPGG